MKKIFVFKIYNIYLRMNYSLVLFVTQNSIFIKVRKV